MSNEQNNTLSSSEVKIILSIAAIIILVVNLIYFLGAPGKIKDDSMIKVDYVGDAVVLVYADENETYKIEGIDGGDFLKSDKNFAFYSDDYKVHENGDPYNIVNSKGKHVGTAKLVSKDTHTEQVYEIDVAALDNPLVIVESYYQTVRVYSSGDKFEHKEVSIQIKERSNPIEVIFEDVYIKAPDISPVLYCFSNVDVTVRAVGEVWLEGGHNPYNLSNTTRMQEFMEAAENAAGAYVVCMSTAIATATVGALATPGISSISGYSYQHYMDMFKGVTALQLNVLDYTWDSVEEAVMGADGQNGLDGIPAIQVAGDVCLVGDAGSYLTLRGGNGGKGQDGRGGLTNTTKGGTGGKGGSGIVCEKYADCMLGELTIISGDGGEGGKGGATLIEAGKTGARGGKNEAKVVLDYEVDAR